MVGCVQLMMITVGIEIDGGLGNVTVRFFTCRRCHHAVVLLRSAKTNTLLRTMLLTSLKLMVRLLREPPSLKLNFRLRDVVPIPELRTPTPLVRTCTATQFVDEWVNMRPLTISYGLSKKFGVLNLLKNVPMP